MKKGHTPKVSEPDINHGFRMMKRLDKYDLSLSELNAHTFQIIEIIEEEKSMIQNQEKQKLENQMKQVQK